MLLVIDNYDSFTWNLVQYLGELGAEMTVRRNDEVSADEVERMAPERIVISPGPGTPADAGVSVEVIRRMGAATPILGVCLGHQAIAAAYGGRVVRARRVMHGKTSPIRHGGVGIFRGVPSPVTVARYHSLTIDPAALPDGLEAVAWTDEAGWEDEIQALRHRLHPVWGVQFHPESIASEAGKDILRNFLQS
ncbi:aminodeoxychorismate/anthranilate synthase component II [Longimicrobium sp.]|uniref:anthranilate synthase component II n=1 Tax=Longimicrobium sp. TaxID=2029185 RepID=UPI002D7F6394|nr:aminodeoxychorismate/anthranilate synthase component II [Longimicrobium sp.]